MLDKLAQIETRYEELANELSSPELLSNPPAYGKAAKQHRSLGEIVENIFFRPLKNLRQVEPFGAFFRVDLLFRHLADKLESRDPAVCPAAVFRDLSILEIDI